jgi:hypothetical protein
MNKSYFQYNLNDDYFKENENIFKDFFIHRIIKKLEIFLLYACFQEVKYKCLISFQQVPYLHCVFRCSNLCLLYAFQISGCNDSEN